MTPATMAGAKTASPNSPIPDEYRVIANILFSYVQYKKNLSNTFLCLSMLFRIGSSDFNCRKCLSRKQLVQVQLTVEKARLD